MLLLYINYDKRYIFLTIFFLFFIYFFFLFILITAGSPAAPTEATVAEQHKQLNKKQIDQLPSTFSILEWEQKLESLRREQESNVTPGQLRFEDEHGETAPMYTGPAHVQYNIFNEDPQFPVSKRLIGPEGTVEEPTFVFSPKPYRIVGCTGPVEDPHPLYWFSMEGYLKHMCPACGQIFLLTADADDCDFSYVDKVDNMKHFASEDH